MYKKKIEDLSINIDKLETEKKKLKELWVAECHPLVIGDKVIANFAYSYEGKEMAVYYIGVTETHYGLFWTAYGNILKKDKTPGVRTGEWRQEC